MGDTDRLIEQLREAVHHSPAPVREIEVGIRLSIVLGQLRPVVSCGGCQTPLEFEGIPARTRTDLKEPFRLILASSAAQ
ncbi:MAG: hypothetical protein L3K04_01470 [Thermoplasmata archaeon]|nr:hypothetical protein [Thermoplasmata archaeon]MCI4338532.1 hypothetical protein [Thermoplasmata archaeon]